MELSIKDRWILSLQYRILERLDPQNANFYVQHRIAIEEGFALHYSSAAAHLYDEMTPGECREVLDILDMYRTLHYAYKDMPDKGDIEEQRITFSGFDGNYETKLMAYTRYVINALSRYQELNQGDFNSHIPSIDRYRRMLAAWKESLDPHELTEEDVKRIVDAA